MITYGFSVQGKSHIERGTVCQDYNKVVRLMNGWYLGVVADGVGSALRSDIGSKMAVESLCNFSKKNFDSKMSNEQLEDLLRRGYEYALEEIVRYAQKENEALDYFDTTLSAVLYNGEKVIYGHAGDGGILVRLYDGRIRPITQRQKGADGSSVRPLRAGESSWDFGIYEEKTAAVLLATDGMLDGVFQPVLVNLPPDMESLARGTFSKDNGYITACEFFMSPYSVYLNKKIADPDKFMEKYMTGNLEREDQEPFLKCMLENYIRLLGKEDAVEVGRRISKYYYAVWALKNVTDDKSVVCLMNEKVKVTPQDTAYYFEPDWKWKQECYDAILYGRPMPTEPEPDVPPGEGPKGTKGGGPEVKVEKKIPQRTNATRHLVIASIIAILVVVGAGVSVVQLFSGREDGTKTQTAKADRTFRPASTPKSTLKSTPKSTISETPQAKATQKPKEDDEIINGRTRQRINQYARDFARTLAQINLLEQDSDMVDGLYEVLEDHDLDDELKRFVSEMKEEPLKDTNAPVNTYTPMPTVTPGTGAGRENKKTAPKKILPISSPAATVSVETLIGDIKLVDTEEKVDIFMNRFKQYYKKQLNKREQEQVYKNLEVLLKNDE